MSRLKDHYEFSPNLQNGDFEHASGFLMECAKVLDSLTETVLYQRLRERPARSLWKKIVVLERLGLLSPPELDALKDVVRLRNAFAHGASTVVDGKVGVRNGDETILLSDEKMHEVLKEHQVVSNRLLDLMFSMSYAIS